MKSRGWLPKLPDSVGGRITAVLGVLLVVLVAIVLAAGWQSRQQSSDVQDSRRAFTIVSATQSGALAWLFADSLTGQYIVSPSPELEATIHATEQNALEQIAIARQAEIDSGELDEVADFDAIQQQAERGLATRQQAIDAAKAGDPVTAGQVLVQGVVESQAVTTTFTNIIARKTADVDASAAHSEQTATLITWILMAAAATVAAGGILAGIAISRSVARPLTALGETSREFGQGNFSVSAEVRGAREVRELATALNSMARSIHKRDEDLSASREQMRALVEYSHDLIMVITPDRKVAFVNPVLEKIFGYKVSEFIGSDVMDMVHPEDVAASSEAFAMVAGGLAESRVEETRVKRADGSWAFMEGIASRIRWGDGNAILLNARDVTAQKEAQATIEFMAFHDSLTGLPNRRLLQDRLDTAITQARRTGAGVGVISVDVDRFKTVNDLLGHSAGDDLLNQVANRLLRIVRESDTVARIGGDEFVIVLPESQSIREAGYLAGRLVNAFRRPFRVEDQDIFVTISAGISHYPEHGSETKDLVSNADAALYAAKNAGRNNYRTFAEDMNERSSEWFAMEADLRRALVNGEIEVFYQPQVDVTTGKLVGAEGLARWRHPDSGLLSPSVFIPLAEETGLINLLGENVLKIACNDARSWPESMRLAVNVSLRQFERPDFVERVLAIVRASGMPLERLELEVTETTALRDIALTRDVSTRLIASGIRLSVDDFGTGSTSLRYLQELPLHQLKIDQTFMTTVIDNPASAAIAAGIISLGHNLGLEVLAEGVETEEQLAFLQANGCDLYQGYLYSRPVPAGDFRALIAAKEAAINA